MFTKQAVLALFLSGSSAKVSVEPSSLGDAQELIVGVLKGAIDQEHLQNLSHCVTDGGNVMKDVNVAVEHMKAGGVKNILALVKDISAIFTQVKSASEDCVAAESDLQKLEEMAAIFKSPRQLAINVINDIKLYQTDIEGELIKGVVDYEAQNWSGLGYQIGEAGSTVLFGKPAQDDIKSARMMQGLVKAFGGNIDLEEALACLGDEITAVRQFELFFQIAKKAFHEKNLKAVLPALMTVVSGLKEAKKGFAECKRIEKTSWDYETMDFAVNKFAQPRMMLAEGEKTFNLESNPKLLIDLMEAAAAYEIGNFSKAGELIGDILKIISEGGLSSKKVENDISPSEYIKLA